MRPGGVLSGMNRRTRALRTSALVLLGLVAAYGVIGGFIAPILARKAIVSDLHERLGRPVELDSVHANPYTLQVRLEGLRILEGKGEPPLAAFDRLDLDASAASLLHFAPVVEEARVQGLRIHVVRTDATHYNFDDIVQRLASRALAAAKQGPAEPARFSISNIQLDGGTIDFDDRPAGATHRVANLQLAIPFLSNLPTNRRDRVQPAFSATVNGAPFRLTGEALPFEQTVRTNFTLDVAGVDLARYLAYLPHDLPVRLDTGTLQAKVALRFTQSPGNEPTIDIAGTAAVAGVALSTAEGSLGKLAKIEVDISSAEPLKGTVRLARVALTQAEAMQGAWRVESASAHDVAIDLGPRAVKVGRVESAGAKLALERRADGSLDMPRLPPSADSKPWRFAVGELKLAGYALTLRDAAVKPAVTHHLTLASLEGHDLGSDRGLSGKLDARAKLDRGGALDVAGSFALEPLEVKAAVDARGVDLVPARAYIAQFPAVELRSALATAKGTVTLQGTLAAPRIAYEGFAQLDRVATFDTLNHEDLLNWKRVKAGGLKLAVAPDAPFRLAVADVDVEDAYSRIVVTPEGKLNVQQLMAATDADPRPAPVAAAPRPRDVRIDRIRFAGSRLNFTDHYIKPNYTADVGDVKGAVTQLSSVPGTRATVMLAGRWDATSPVVITGTVNPLSGNLFLDIGAQGQQIDLTKLTAYSQRYAGYGIKAGRLTLDVKYHVEDGKMEGRNRILVDQLAFGDKVESPDATKLPVLFAVSLLKDKEGRINLELPVSGSLEDPKFEFGALIAQVFSSHIAKAQSSPFALLGGEGDLGFVDFEAGHPEMGAAAQAKLDKLVALLLDRPGLRIEVVPAPLGPEDLAALELAARERRLAEAPKDLSKEAREKLAQQPVEIGEAERRAVEEARVASIRDYLAAASRLTPERVVVANGGAAPPADAAAKPGRRIALALR